MTTPAILRLSEEGKRYEALKRDLAASFWSDREAYTNGKNYYIRAVMSKAGCEEMGKNSERVQSLRI